MHGYLGANVTCRRARFNQTGDAIGGLGPMRQPVAHAFLVDAAPQLLALGERIKEPQPLDVPTVSFVPAVRNHNMIERLFLAATAAQSDTDHNYPLAVKPNFQPNPKFTKPVILLETMYKRNLSGLPLPSLRYITLNY